MQKQLFFLLLASVMGLTCLEKNGRDIHRLDIYADDFGIDRIIWYRPKDLFRVDDIFADSIFKDSRIDSLLPDIHRLIPSPRRYECDAKLVCLIHVKSAEFPDTLVFCRNQFIIFNDTLYYPDSSLLRGFVKQIPRSYAPIALIQYEKDGSIPDKYKRDTKPPFIPL